MKKFNLRVPVRASIWYAGTSFIAKAVGFLVTPFFTRMISGEKYGELTLYLTLVGIGSTSCSAVNTGSAIFKGIKKHESEKGSFLKSALFVSLSFSAVICTVLFAFSPFFNIKRHLFIPLTLQIMCDSIVAVALSSAKFSYQYKQVALISILSSVLPAIITLSILRIVNGRFRVRVYALLVISLCLAAWELIKIFQYPGRIKRKVSVDFFKSALPLIPHSISSALSGQADKMIITYLMGSYALAKYSVTHSLGVALQFIVGAIGFALGPWIIRKLDSNMQEKINNLVELLFYGISALCLCLIALAPEAMKILAPPEYLEAFPALLPIVITTPLSLVCSVITICLVHFGQGKATTAMALVGAGVNLLLNFTLIPKLGYLGAGLATLLSALSSMLIGLYVLTKARLLNLISPRRILGRLLYTAIISIVLLILFEAPSLRILVLIIPAIILLNVFYNAKSLIVE